jgi:3-hydroxy-9,10-secoandrosta-1,3,5(10)-triene-9,17-dione monooxygenase
VDDWFVLGMRGTASRTVRADGVFVPDHRVLDRDVLLARLGPGLRTNTGPLYRSPQGYLYNVVAGAPAVGAAWAFYAEFVAQMRKVVRRFDNIALAEERVQLIRLARTRVAIEEQERNVLDTLARGYRQAQEGVVPDELELARGIYDMSRVTTPCLEVAHELFPALSASAVSERNPLQRLYRDLLTARQHFTQNTDFTAATAGNLELGNEAAAAFMLTPERLAVAEQRAAELYG